jgi:hypothetical protein
MAKFNGSGLFGDGRGKFGKTILSKNRYSGLAYPQPEFIADFSDAQILSQNKHAAVLELWHKFSPEDIMIINRYAADSYVRQACAPSNVSTGYLLFIHLNRNLLEIGVPMISDLNSLGLASNLQHIHDFRIEIKKYRSKPGLRLFADSVIEPNTKVIIYATPSIQGGIGTPKDCWFRKISVIDSDFKYGSYITSDYLRVFGSIDTKAMSIFFRFKTVDKRSGFASFAKFFTSTLSIRKIPSVSTFLPNLNFDSS